MMTPTRWASLPRAFRLAGHEATVCDNPIKLLEMIKAEKYDVIFSDLVMPAMNGLALLGKIRRRAWRRLW
jgi:two-component system nitrogen regulation response regulator NtrX